MKPTFTNLLAFARARWHAIQRRAPAWIEPRILPALFRFRDVVQLLLKPRLVTRHFYASEREDAPGAIGVGLNPKAGVLPRLRAQWPSNQSANETPFWNVRAANFGKSVDLIAVEGPVLLIRTLPRQNALILPRLVWHTVDVTGEWENVCRRFHRSVRTNELRWVRKYEYRFEISRETRHMEHFFRRMYLPTMEARHRDNAKTQSYPRLLEMFENGLLLQVFNGNNWISGALCEIRSNGLHFCEVGVLDSDENLMKQGAMAAVYVGVIQWANRMGYRQVHLTTSAPFLADGIFRHKRRWGTRISLPVADQNRIWIRIRHYTPAAHLWVAANPMITVDEDGSMHGLVPLHRLEDWTPAQAIQWRKCFDLPGLTSIRLLPLDRFQETGVLSQVKMDARQPLHP